MIWENHILHSLQVSNAPQKMIQSNYTDFWLARLQGLMDEIRDYDHHINNMNISWRITTVVQSSQAKHVLWHNIWELLSQFWPGSLHPPRAAERWRAYTEFSKESWSNMTYNIHTYLYMSRAHNHGSCINVWKSVCRPVKYFIFRLFGILLLWGMAYMIPGILPKISARMDLLYPLPNVSCM